MRDLDTTFTTSDVEGTIGTNQGKVVIMTNFKRYDIVYDHDKQGVACGSWFRWLDDKG